MSRRAFLSSAAASAAGAAAMVAPSIVRAQSQPTVEWKLASSFPRSLDTIYGAAELLAKRVASMTQGKFKITVSSAGEVVKPLEVLEAVQEGKIQAGHTALYYWFAKDPTYAIPAAIPFGPNARQTSAWWNYAGGRNIFNDFTRKQGFVAHLAGNTGAQMGGWFKKDINSVDDLKGLKMRLGGFAGLVMKRLGLEPIQLPAGEIAEALAAGKIDAAEWIGPYDDEKLGLNKSAKNYYYPGWWEGGLGVHSIVNSKDWDALPLEYRTAFEVACAEANMWMLSKYDALNPAALKRLVAGGAQLKPFPNSVMDACYKASQETFAEISAKNENFARIFNHQQNFLKDSWQWNKVAESAYDTYMIQHK